MNRWIPRDCATSFAMRVAMMFVVAGEVADRLRTRDRRRGRPGGSPPTHAASPAVSLEISVTSPSSSSKLGEPANAASGLRSIHHSIEHANAVARLQQSFDRQGADIAGAADDEHGAVTGDRQRGQRRPAAVGQAEQQPGDDGRGSVSSAQSTKLPGRMPASQASAQVAATERASASPFLQRTPA